MHKVFSFWFCLSLVLLLAGCSGEPIARNLSQKEANQIVAVLASHGISADIESSAGGRAKFEVSVNQGDFTSAVTVLNQSRLLEASQFEEMIGERGILPSSRDFESLRVDHARALEIAEHLESHPAIASAKVAMRHNLLQENAEPGISCLIQTRPAAQITKEEIVQIVSSLVPGIKPEHVMVNLSALDAGPAQLQTDGVQNKKGKVLYLPVTPFMLGARVVEDDYRRLAFGLLGFLVVVAVLSAVVGYWYGNYRGSAASLAKPTLLDPASSRLERIEGPGDSNHPEV